MSVDEAFKSARGIKHGGLAVIRKGSITIKVLDPLPRAVATMSLRKPGERSLFLSLPIAQDEVPAPDKVTRDRKALA